jgi:hypothetical protein
MSDKLKDNNLDETIRNNGVIRTLINIFGAKSYDNAKRIINEMRDDVNSL